MTALIKLIPPFAGLIALLAGLYAGLSLTTQAGLPWFWGVVVGVGIGAALSLLLIKLVLPIWQRVDQWADR